MSIGNNICNSCRAINSGERTICGICGTKLAPETTIVKQTYREVPLEELIEYYPRPFILIIFAVVNCIEFGIEILTILPINPELAIVVALFTPIPLIVLYYLLEGSNYARIIIICFDLLGLFIITDALYFIFNVIELGFLVLDPRINKYCTQ